MAEVVVWWAHTQDLTSTHRDWLDATERARLARLKQREDRDRFTLGSALVRSLVAALDDTDPAGVTLDRSCARCTEQHGPVTAPGRGWSCSVSHSGAFAVAAAAPAPARLGVDIETRCPADWSDLLPRVLAPGESAPGDEVDFLRLWVRKEAVLKATGHGLGTSMTSVSLSGEGRATVDHTPFRVVDLDLGALRAVGLEHPAAAAVAVVAHRGARRWQRGRLGP